MTTSRKEKVSQWIEYTLEAFKAHALSDARFKRDFDELPHAKSIHGEHSTFKLLAASSSHRVHVGHMSILFGFCAGTCRRDFAYLNYPSIPVNASGVRFCVSDETTIFDSFVPNIELKEPFSAVRLFEDHPSWLCSRLQALVLYYFLAKDYLKKTRFDGDRPTAFKIACSNVSDVELHGYKAPSRKMRIGVELGLHKGQKRRIVETQSYDHRLWERPDLI